MQSIASKRALALMFAGSLMLCRIAAAADASAYDHTFMQSAAYAGGTEMATGKLVASKHASDAVKAFAAAMTKDHGWVAVASKHLLQTKEIKVSHTPDAAHQAEIDALKDLDGQAFDAQYAKIAVAGHKETLALFSDAGKNAVDRDLKAFAQKMLPQVQRHYTMAVALQAAVGKQ